MKHILISLLICGLLFSYAPADELHAASQKAQVLQKSDCHNAVALTDGVNSVERDGAYHIYGKATGQLVVNAKGGEVYLLLDGVNLSSPDGPAIYIKAAGHVYIVAAEGTQSYLTDSQTYILPEGEDEPNAAIFSKADLFIGGTGQLSVTGQYKNGIVGKDSLAIESNVAVNAVGKGIKARDIHVTGGDLRVSAQDDAIHASDSVVINDGVITLAAGDDGIHADDTLIISGGKVSVSDSNEGFEAAHIQLNDGTTSVNSIDDGWNAASKAATEAAGDKKTYDFSLVVAGGCHSVIAGADAIDSNGSILVSGGITYAATSNDQKEVPLDYPMNCECKITGGIIAIAGPYGKQIQTFNKAENQACLLVKWKQAQSANTHFALQDEHDSSILSFQVPTAFQAIVISGPQIQVGGAYRVLTDDIPSKTRTVTEASMFFPVTEPKQTASRLKRVRPAVTAR